MLVLDVRVDIGPDHEHALNEWYHTHVPRLVSLPGYESGRRYAALTEGPKYCALYEIPDKAALPSLLGDDPDLRHPLTLSEWADWDRHFVPYMKHGSTNLYEADVEFPLLKGDHPIVEVRFGAPRSADALLQAELAHPARSLDGVANVTMLRAAGEPEVAWLETRPSSLLLLQMRDEKAAVELVSTKLFHELARGMATDVETVAYTQIARHWPYMKEA